MKVTILTPTSQKVFEVSWIEAQTTQGNYVILPGHAPLTVQLAAHSVFMLGIHDATESLVISSGLLTVDRHTATVILDE